MKKITNKITHGITNEQQTNNKQITTNKNDKNIKNEKKIRNDVEEITKYYEENIGLITPAIAEKLFDYLNDMNKELIIQAIKTASINNKRSMQYIQGILNDWNRKGIKTLLEAEQENKNFKNKNNKQVKEETFEEKVARYKREWGVEDED